MPRFNPKLGDLWAEEILETLTNTLEQDAADISCHTIPAAIGSYNSWPTWVAPELTAHFHEHGITTLFSHQATAAELAWQHSDVIVATGTSSGKSLAYLLPVFTRLQQNPQATALYLTPTKALGADQLQNAQRIASSLRQDIHPASYDGDTARDGRALIRERSRFIFTNPDMLHVSILSNHQRWARLLRNVEFIIIDEAHSYRGVFGAHVALLLRRLLRLARRYGANPTIFLASATSANPAAHATQLVGREVQAITKDGSPHGPRTIVLWTPPVIPGSEPQQRRAVSAESASIMANILDQGLRTLTFVRSRREAEIVALEAARQVQDQEVSAQIKAYRAGYLPAERRALEQAFDSGLLRGVASTNALELGIDIGGLDAVLISGFPGSIASFWQQGGRAGRRGQSALVFFVARNNPLDAYLCKHPTALLDAPIERNVFDVTNPTISHGHLACAAWEAPLSPVDFAAFGGEEVIARATAAGILRQRGNQWFAAQLEDPHPYVSLRGAGGVISIVEGNTGEMLGTIDTVSARTQVHPGAIYLHQGADYQISDLDFEQNLAIAFPSEHEYRTEVRSTSDIRILEAPTAAKQLRPGLWLSNLWVEVRDEVKSYEVRSYQGEGLGEHPLDLPPVVLETRAVAYTVDPLLLDECGIAPADIPGALHAAEHAAIGILPLVATCDRLDIGGVSTAVHPDTGLPTVFVYDGHPGGAGFADCGYELFATWMRMTFEAVQECPCETGCPGCIQSPKCGNGNKPLDKPGAIALLAMLAEVDADQRAPAPGQDTPKFLGAAE
ncbi:MAG: DEAD/DEAH box helicase [Corynebacterium sp.]|nr:DEAD/DEAH box helicase [Corynebacterium sp.]